ncbi:MAG: hypothetical protein AAF790_04170 [Planctomycetota bacterium]
MPAHKSALAFVLSRGLFAAAAVAAPFAPAPLLRAADEGPQAYTLRYKFETGDVIRYEVDHRASIRSTMEKTTQQAVTPSESVKAWKVIDVAETKACPEGEIEFQNVVERVKMTNRLPDRAEMVYDSEQEETPPPGFESAAEAVGVPLSAIRMTPWGEIIERTIKHHQPAADPSAPITVLLPKQPVAVGDSWDEPQDIKVNAADGKTKIIKTRRHFTLKSVKTGVAVIEAKQQVLSPTTAAIDGQLVQRMMKGTIRFDIARGRILSQRMDVDRRVLGFAGRASSMHYVMRMEERLAGVTKAGVSRAETANAETATAETPKTAFRERSVLVGPAPSGKK